MLATTLLVLLAASFMPASATLPRRDVCYEILCTSFVMSQVTERDRTYHHGSNGKHLLIVRFEDGSIAQILAEWVAERGCLGAESGDVRIRSVEAAHVSDRRVITQGCLSSQAAERYLRVTLDLTSAVLPAESMMHYLDPQVSVPAVSRAGYVFGMSYDLGHLVLSPPPHEP